MQLALPGSVNRGNAAQAVAAAVALGADPAKAVAAVSAVDEVAGRYRTVRIGQHEARILLAKNPAGWQEALSMVDQHAAGVVISVNGQIPDGEDLSWLWDVRFEHFAQAFNATPVVAAGERGTDLAVRLGYAGVAAHAGARHHGGHRVLPARASRGRRQLHRVPAAAAEAGTSWLMLRPSKCGSGWCCPT